MDYSLSGHFIEACDCTIICPCWVDDSPVGGHCTGLVAWSLETDETAEDGQINTINGVDVAGSTVVSVSTHGGYRRDGSQTTTVLYVDTRRETPQGHDERVELLALAFGGELDGPLKGLAAVSGTVIMHEPADIDVTSEPGGEWTVTVRPVTADASADGDVALVLATGIPKVFDTDEGNVDPLVLHHTALSHELGVPADDEEVQAQQGEHLELAVGALPGGNLHVSGRSGMRGRFEYVHSPGVNDTRLRGLRRMRRRSTVRT